MTTIELFDDKKIGSFLAMTLWQNYEGTMDAVDDDRILQSCIEKTLHLEGGCVNTLMDTIRFKAFGQTSGIDGVVTAEGQLPTKRVKITDPEDEKKSLEITIVDFNDQKIVKFAGMHQKDYLIYNLYFLLERYWNVKKRPFANQFEVDVRKLLLVLEEEIKIVINAYLVRRDCEEILKSGNVEKLEEYLRELISFIRNTNDGMEYCIPCGSSQHAVYITLLYFKNTQEIVVRIDNSSRENTTLLRNAFIDQKIWQETDVLGATSVADNSLVEYLCNAIRQLLQTNTDTAMVEIYNQSRAKKYSFRSCTNEYKSLSKQTALNCVIEGFRRGMWYRLWKRCDTREDTIYKWLVRGSIEFSSLSHVVVTSVFLRATQLRDQLDRDKFLRLYPVEKDRVETLDNKKVQPEEKHWTLAEYSHNILDYDDYIPLIIMTPKGPSSLDAGLEKALPLSNKLNIVLLHGENGTGKTESAMYYCKTRTLTYSGGIYTFNGQDFDSFNASLFGIAKKSAVECDYEDFNDVKEKTIGYIIKRDGLCLLLFDNVDTEEMQKIMITTLEKLKTETMRSMHVLITSTISLWSRRGLSIQSFAIEGFMENSDHDIHQAREYLSKTIPMQIEDNEHIELLDELIKLLGTLPLLLSQVATYCQAHPISAFIERYSKNWENQKELLDNESIFGSKVYKKRLYTAWITKVTYVQTHLNNCSSLLHCISFVKSQQIPEIQLLYYFIDETLDAEKAKMIEFLRSQSILHVDYRAGTFRIHRMLQEIIRINLHDTGLYSKSLDDVLSRASKAFSYDYYETNSYKSAMLTYQHVKVILEHTKELQSDKHYKIFEALALYYQEILGQFKISVNMLRDVYSYYNKKNSEYSVTAAINLAGAIRSAADFEEASQWYETALKMIDPSDTTLKMEVRVYCAQCEHMRHNSKVAIEEFHLALSFFRENARNVQLKRFQIDIARTLAFLAAALRKYEGPWFDLCRNRDHVLTYAIDCLFEAQTIYLTWVGEDHDAYAEIFGDIAHSYDDIGDFNSAQVYYQKALDNQKRILGPNHPWVAATYYEYGITLLSIKKPAQAMEQIQIASGIITTDTFAGNLYYYVCLLKFYVHDFINQKSAAIDCLECVVSSFTKKGITCQKIVTFRYEISWRREWTDLCQPTDVDLEYYTSVKKLLEIIYGPLHPEIANCHRRVSLVYLNLRDIRSAKKSLKDASKIMKSIGLVNKDDINCKKLLSLDANLQEKSDSKCVIH